MSTNQSPGGDIATKEYCSVGTEQVLTATFRLVGGADQVPQNETSLGASFDVCNRQKMHTLNTCAFFFIREETKR